MTRTWKRRWRELVLLLAALACAGTWAASQVRSARDRSEVAKMTEKQKTVCVGRLLVDVPDHAEVELSRAMLDGFQIDAREESLAEFHDRIATREARLRSDGKSGAAKAPEGMIEARDLDIPGMQGRLLVHSRDRTYGIEQGRRVNYEWVKVEAHAHIGGMSFSLSKDFTGEESARTAELLLARLQLRGDNEIPAASGFCTWRAVFTEPLPPHTAEHVALSIGLPGHPELALVLDSTPGRRQGDSLLERVARTDAQASPDEMLRVTKLRVGSRSINGMAGEESLERVRELNFATTYGFLWETRGVDGDLMRPFLSLELQSGINRRPGGKPVDASLHEDAVLALWDSISSTIRLRKSDPPPPVPAAAPDGPKLGTAARAGDRCPASGWWECAAGGDGLRVHGGQVQFVRKGERMPQALLLPRQTLWQKVRGIQPGIEPDRPTVWQLVDQRARPRVPAPAPLAPAGIGAPALAMTATAVGSYVRTGEPCPASGWWRCEASHALDGTRWFAAGSLLPAATFRVPGGVFGRGTGPETIQRRSVWQLVRPADAPAPTAPPAPA